MIYAENILICIAVPYLVVLYFVRGKVRKFVLAFLFGMAACLLSAYISAFLGEAAGLGKDTAVFLSPVVEELMKFLPLLIYLYFFYPDEESFFLTAIAVGTGFATFENCCYILTYGANRLSYIMIRGFSVGVMHIVSILMLTLGLSVFRYFRSLSLPSIFGSLSLSVTFHGLYNLLVSGGGIFSAIGYLIPLLTAFICVFPYRMMRAIATKQKNAEQPEGLPY